MAFASKGFALRPFAETAFLDLIPRGEEQIVEECDDGEANADAPDACRLSCRLPANSDGITDSSLAEECDDNNGDDEDSCTNLGKANVCGDGVENRTIDLSTDAPFEECDDGPDDSDLDGCKSDCSLNYCGDGKLNPAEEACDDGNFNRSDGCDPCRKTDWVPEVVFGFGEGGAEPGDLKLGNPGPMGIDPEGNIFWFEVRDIL
ncbi:MAG: DUF4215 domain-containing protein [Deltaproteobacteria bacterium]|nr:DUF4215 domain-containing protein [Deltaproteobacteria bacterium]